MVLNLVNEGRKVYGFGQNKNMGNCLFVKQRSENYNLGIYGCVFLNHSFSIGCACMSSNKNLKSQELVMS